MERFKRWKKEVFYCSWGHRSIGSRRLGYWLVVIATCCITLGCTTLKKASIVSLSAGGGALVGGLASNGILAPVTGAVVSSAVADVVTEVAIGKGGKQSMSSCAPDNFWTLLGNIISMGGWLLILVIVIPMILGWLLPGPLEKAKKKRK